MKSFLSLMLVVTTLTSCSGPMQWIIEGQIDRLIANRMAKSLNLYWGQERELRQEVPGIRLILVPELELIKNQVIGFLEKPSLDQEIGTNLYLSWRQATIKLNPFLAKWMAQLDQKQVEKMLVELDQENKKLQAEIETPQDSMFLRRFELLLGDLSESQKSLILANKSISLRPYQRRLERRLKSRHFLASLYQQTYSVEEKNQKITDFFNAITQEPVPKDEWNFQQSLIQQIYSSSTQEQKDHLVKQLNRFLWLLDTLLQQESPDQ
jgi:hypothetical protein